MKQSVKTVIAIVAFGLLMAMGISYIFKSDKTETNNDQDQAQLDSLSVKSDSLKHQADSLWLINDSLKKK